MPEAAGSVSDVCVGATISPGLIGFSRSTFFALGAAATTSGISPGFLLSFALVKEGLAPRLLSASAVAPSGAVFIAGTTIAGKTPGLLAAVGSFMRGGGKYPRQDGISQQQR